MKRVLIATVLCLGISSPSFAWYDSYGGFTCGYLDPLTTILDNIFGPPCPPPVVVVPVAPPPSPPPVVIGDAFMTPNGVICQPLSNGTLNCF